MKIIAVENNPRDLKTLKDTAQALFPQGEVEGFTDPLLAIKHCMEHPPDVVLAERDLKRMDGFALMKTLRQKFPPFRGVLLSDDSSWKRDTEKLMLGFVEKPVTTQKLCKEIHIEEERK